MEQSTTQCSMRESQQQQSRQQEQQHRVSLRQNTRNTVQSSSFSRIFVAHGLQECGTMGVHSACPASRFDGNKNRKAWLRPVGDAEGGSRIFKSSAASEYRKSQKTNDKLQINSNNQILSFKQPANGFGNSELEFEIYLSFAFCHSGGIYYAKLVSLCFKTCLQ